MDLRCRGCSARAHAATSAAVRLVYRLYCPERAGGRPQSRASQAVRYEGPSALSASRAGKDLAHGNSHRHRQWGIDRIGVGASLRSIRLPRHRSGKRHAIAVFRTGGFDPTDHPAARGSARRFSFHRSRYPGGGRRRARIRAVCPGDRASDPHRRAAVARLGSVRSAD